MRANLRVSNSPLELPHVHRRSALPLSRPRSSTVGRRGSRGLMGVAPSAFWRFAVVLNVFRARRVRATCSSPARSLSCQCRRPWPFRGWAAMGRCVRWIPGPAEAAASPATLVVPAALGAARLLVYGALHLDDAASDMGSHFEVMNHYVCAGGGGHCWPPSPCYYQPLRTVLRSPSRWLDAEVERRGQRRRAPPSTSRADIGRGGNQTDRLPTSWVRCRSPPRGRPRHYRFRGKNGPSPVMHRTRSGACYNLAPVVDGGSGRL